MTFYSYFFSDLLLFMLYYKFNISFISHGKVWKIPHIYFRMELLVAHLVILVARNSIIATPPPPRITTINLKQVHPSTTIFVIYRRQRLIILSPVTKFSRVTIPICAITQIHFFNYYDYSLLQHLQKSLLLQLI